MILRLLQNLQHKGSTYSLLERVRICSQRNASNYCIIINLDEFVIELTYDINFLNRPKAIPNL